MAEMLLFIANHLPLSESLTLSSRSPLLLVRLMSEPLLLVKVEKAPKVVGVL
jgi:hypothetical protein